MKRKRKRGNEQDYEKVKQEKVMRRTMKRKRKKGNEKDYEKVKQEKVMRKTMKRLSVKR